jgi:hypothetical protein
VITYEPKNETSIIKCFVRCLLTNSKGKPMLVDGLEVFHDVRPSKIIVKPNGVLEFPLNEAEKKLAERLIQDQIKKFSVGGVTVGQN